jgi:hypothetical protein
MPDSLSIVHVRRRALSLAGGRDPSLHKDHTEIHHAPSRLTHWKASYMVVTSGKAVATRSGYLVDPRISPLSPLRGEMTRDPMTGEAPRLWPAPIVAASSVVEACACALLMLQHQNALACRDSRRALLSALPTAPSQTRPVFPQQALLAYTTLRAASSHSSIHTSFLRAFTALSISSILLHFGPPRPRPDVPHTSRCRRAVLRAHQCQGADLSGRRLVRPLLQH